MASVNTEGSEDIGSGVAQVKPTKYLNLSLAAQLKQAGIISSNCDNNAPQAQASDSNHNKEAGGDDQLPTFRAASDIDR